MFPKFENAPTDTQALLKTFDEAAEVLRELAKLVLPSGGKFHTVFEITNEVCDHYYHAKAA